ncbi:hypothetical protein F4808DRAFT_420699 [Astrocystis sublimbata]|nr:hypothetical protein F4808DRAFT_420699 [Astrocystis sublimbata]
MTDLGHSRTMYGVMLLAGFSPLHSSKPLISSLFSTAQEIGELLFGSRGDDLEKPSNSLLLTSQIKGWFDRYCLIIIPVDAEEMPITRWKIELLGNSVAEMRLAVAQVRLGPVNEPNVPYYGRDLDGREFTFRSEARPASRFLYFHFMLALVRMRDIQPHGWKETWARLFTTKPFPTPGPYLRETILLAINQYLGTTDLKLIESWIRGQGFDDPIQLSSEHANRVASRVKAAIEEVEEADEDEGGWLQTKDEEEQENSGDEDSEDEESDDDEGYKRTLQCHLKCIATGRWTLDEPVKGESH